jgi:hypothetical protein
VLIMNLVIYINEKSRIYNFLKALKWT